MKRLFSFAVTMALLLCLSPAAFAVVDQSESFYAADYSNVLKESTEQRIIQANAALEQQCQGAQIVVVTVDYLNGMYSDEYAYELFNDWGVGSSEYDNGMLLLLATQENKAWLAYGLGISSQLDGGQAEQLLDDYFWDDFDNGDYDGAVNKLFDALLEWYDGQYGSSTAVSADTASDRSFAPGEDRRGGVNLFTVVIIIIVIIVLVSIFSRPVRRRRRASGAGFMAGYFIGSRRRRTPPPPPPPPMGGGRPPVSRPRRPAAPPPRMSRPSAPPPTRRPSPPRPTGGAGRGGRPSGGGMGRGGGGFSGGGAGRR